MSGDRSIVIIGAGHAGVEAADAFRRADSTAAITLFDAQAAVPYQRPPLSKDYMHGTEMLPIRAESFFNDSQIDLRSCCPVDRIDRDLKCVIAQNGSRVNYSTLVIATGARERALPIASTGLDGVHRLRTLADAAHLRQRLKQARNLVIIGAGFVGLEFAAVARAEGLNVTVLEAADRVMARAVSPTISQHFAHRHRAAGIDIHLGEGIQELIADPQDRNRVAGALSQLGEFYPADLVLLAVGVLANDEIAMTAGLSTNDGILVDGQLRTEDPNIYAIGDCARFPCVQTGRPARLESIQNATAHAHYAAAAITGSATGRYQDLPWFWSVQADARLSIAGMSGAGDQTVVRGEPDSGRFSVFSFRDDALTAVESVNRPADHIVARQLLAGGLSVTPEQASDGAFDLKAYVLQHSHSGPVRA